MTELDMGRPAEPGEDAVGRVHAAYAGIVELLQAQASLLEQLEAITREQGGVMERAEPAGVLSFLGERQAVIDALAEATPRVEGAASAWRAVEAHAGPRLSQNVRARFEAIGDLAHRIAERDAAARSALARRRDAIAAELSRLTRSRRAIGAYTPGAGAPPQFQDAEG